MSELRSLSLEAALYGAVALARVERAMPAMPGLPALPRFDAPRQLLGRAFDHVASFRLRPSGIWTPTAPVLVSGASAPRSAVSGTAGGRMRWVEAVDLDGLVAFLRARHPAKTAANVAALTGEPIETVRKWLRFETKPSLRATIVLVCVYELPLIEACLRRHPDWMVRMREDSGRHALAAELAALRPRIDAALGGAS